MTGRYHGREDNFRGGLSWPPSPARLFQALVAGAARGASFLEQDKKALTWLEAQPPPVISAPAVRKGQSVKFFVPNNDLDAVDGNPARISEIRVQKLWQPLFFNEDQPVFYLWEIEQGNTEANQVCRLAQRLYQLGRSFDVAWATGQVLEKHEAKLLFESQSGVVNAPGGIGEVAVPCRGTFDSLVRRYQGKRGRLTTVGEGRKARQLFSQPPKAYFANSGYNVSPTRIHFELRNAEGKFAPRPLASAASLITSIRDSAAARLISMLPESAAQLERLIIGRGASAADVPQRIRLIPIPSIGTQHTDPSIRRIMLEIPPNCPIRADDLQWGVAGVQPYNPQTGESWLGNLVSSKDSKMADRFARASRKFQSITPLALSKTGRREKHQQGRSSVNDRTRQEQRAVREVAQALRHAGIDAHPRTVRVQKEQFQRRGMRAEAFAEGSRFPKSALWHVEVEFSQAIPGPVVLGDGRYCGLGLMQPIACFPDAVAYNLSENSPIPMAHRGLVIRHLRRALMSLARGEDGRVGLLFSGHERDGSPDRASGHAHVYLAADGDECIERLIVAAPWCQDSAKRPKEWEQRLFDRVTQNLSELNAGRAGCLRDLKPTPLESGDSLIGPAKSWVSKTNYVASRNLKKREDLELTIKADVSAECTRRRLPLPTEIRVRNPQVGPRGGRPTANLTLRFAVAISGLLLLGRDSHHGGGLFCAR